jgi:hypothetical protein
MNYYRLLGVLEIFFCRKALGVVANQVPVFTCMTTFINTLIIKKYHNNVRIFNFDTEDM